MLFENITKFFEKRYFTRAPYTLECLGGNPISVEKILNWNHLYFLVQKGLAKCYRETRYLLKTLRTDLAIHTTSLSISRNDPDRD